MIQNKAEPANNKDSFKTTNVKQAERKWSSAHTDFHRLFICYVYSVYQVKYV